MIFRCKIFLLSFLVVSSLSFCSKRYAQNQKEEKAISDSIAEAEAQAEAAEDSIAEAQADSVVQDTSGQQAVVFDTAQQATLHPFDKNKWNKKIEAIDYSEKHLEKKVKTNTPLSGPFDLSGVGKMILALLVIGVLALLIWRLVAVPRFSDTDQKENILTFSEDHPEKMGNSELDELLKSYLKEKNYRFAIRILYLIILKRFSEKKLIRWNKEKTNRHYIYELSGTPVQQGFSNLTMFYDTAWYGDHIVNENQFDQVEKIAGDLLNASIPYSTETR